VSRAYGRTRFSGDFQFRYRVYARDHSMTPEQMLGHDGECCPYALLKPYFLWLSCKRFEWGQQNPNHGVHGVKEEAEFEHWLDQIAPASNALTCECHLKLNPHGHPR
jgi:hypothetical protein